MKKLSLFTFLLATVLILPLSSAVKDISHQVPPSSELTVSSASNSEQVNPNLSTSDHFDKFTSRFGWVQFQEIFSASPVIYSSLIFLSLCSFFIWLYTLMSLRTKEIVSSKVVHTLQALLSSGRYEDAIFFCEKQKNLVASMVASGLSSRHLGPQFIQESMKAEGKRVTVRFWQRLSLISDIIYVSPMLGLLGTVLGMFYAFYDINNSQENISALFDGLGLAIGTTVAGLTVAILSMLFHTTLKYRLIRVLTTVENESITLANLIEPLKIDSLEREGAYVSHS